MAISSAAEVSRKALIFVARSHYVISGGQKEG